MLNTNNSKGNNSNTNISKEKEKNKKKFINIDTEIDYWELFQSETDETRNLLLNYLTKKCEVHKTENYQDPADYEVFEIIEYKSPRNFHFEECRNFLFQSEKRRNPFKNGKLLYSKNPCQNFLKKIECPKGENCEFSHNQLEILFHPFNYRKFICNYNECEKNKAFCFNAHRNQEKRKFPNLGNKAYKSREYKESKENNNEKKNYNKNFYIKNNGNEINNNEDNTREIILDKKDKNSINKENALNSLNDNESNGNNNNNMLNQLNLDIKNLLDEVDFENLGDDEEEEIIKDGDLNLNESKGFLFF